MNNLSQNGLKLLYESKNTLKIDFKIDKRVILTDYSIFESAF
jgi:hypothetical protein